MKTKQKGIYQPPTSMVVEMKVQGVLCESQSTQFINLGILGNNPVDGVQDYSVQDPENWI